MGPEQLHILFRVLSSLVLRLFRHSCPPALFERNVLARLRRRSSVVRYLTGQRSVSDQLQDECASSLQSAELRGAGHFTWIRVDLDAATKLCVVSILNL